MVYENPKVPNAYFLQGEDGVIWQVPADSGGWDKKSQFKGSSQTLQPLGRGGAYAACMKVGSPMNYADARPR